MAEENKDTKNVVDGSDDKGASQVEGQETSQTTEADAKDQARKDQARSQGWLPRKEWVAAGKDENDWRSAKEFLDRGDLLKTIKETKAELRKYGEAITSLSQHNKQVYEAGYKRALQELKAAKVQALEEGNHKAVVDIEEQIDNTRYQLARVQSQQVAPPTPDTSSFDAFRSENTWYDRDKNLQFWAHGTAIDYAKAHPNVTEKEVYAFLAQEVKRQFPEKFGRRGPPSPDGEGRQTGAAGKSTASGGSKSFENLMASLPEDQAKAARQLVKMGVITKEKYVKDYEDIGANR